MFHISSQAIGSLPTKTMSQMLSHLKFNHHLQTPLVFFKTQSGHVAVVEKIEAHEVVLAWEHIQQQSVGYIHAVDGSGLKAHAKAFGR